MSITYLIELLQKSIDIDKIADVYLNIIKKYGNHQYISDETYAEYFEKIYAVHKILSKKYRIDISTINNPHRQFLFIDQRIKLYLEDIENNDVDAMRMLADEILLDLKFIFENMCRGCARCMHMNYFVENLIGINIYDYDISYIKNALQNKAIYLYESAINKNDKISMIKLADYYYHNMITEDDDQNAYNYYNKALFLYDKAIHAPYLNYDINYLISKNGMYDNQFRTLDIIIRYRMAEMYEDIQSNYSKAVEYYIDVYNGCDSKTELKFCVLLKSINRHGLSYKNKIKLFTSPSYANIYRILKNTSLTWKPIYHIFWPFSSHEAKHMVLILLLIHKYKHKYIRCIPKVIMMMVIAYYCNFNKLSGKMYYCIKNGTKKIKLSSYNTCLRKLDNFFI